MPKRPRQHQLEKESWDGLSNVIPSNWVLRKLDPDYGVDGEIEIFDERGNSTGLKFNLQLKGTDIEDKAKSLSHRFLIETIDYYLSLQLPVLLVKYLSASKELYYKWAYQIDPYYARKGSKSIKVTFPEKNKWGKETPSLMFEQLQIFRQLKEPYIKLPIEFNLEFTEDELFSVPNAIIESALIEAANSLSEFIVIKTKLSKLLVPKIEISRDIILIDLASLVTFTLHISRPYSNEQIRAYFHNDIIVGIALALNRLGQSSIAAEISYNHILASTLLDYPDTVFEIASFFVKGRKIDMAIKLAESLLEKGGDYSKYFILCLPAYIKVDLTESEYQSFKDLILKAAAKFQDIGDLEETGICYYNLANTTMCQRRYKESIHYFKLAAKYDQNYKKRDYFWREIAGMLFLSGKYRFSERFYNKTFELSENMELLALRADALMFLGEYKAARFLFEEYLKSNDAINSQWVLKEWFLRKLIEDMNILEQKRCTSEAMKLADVKNIPAEKIEDRISMALNFDALCNAAWFNKGVTESSSGDDKKAFESFLCAGIVVLEDVEAWTNALICGFNSLDSLEALPLIIDTAYENNGEKFINHFYHTIENQPEMPKKVKTKIINAFRDIFRSIELKKQKYPVLRLLKPDGTYIQSGPDIKGFEDLP